MSSPTLQIRADEQSASDAWKATHLIEFIKANWHDFLTHLEAHGEPEPAEAAEQILYLLELDLPQVVTSDAEAA